MWRKQPYKMASSVYRKVSKGIHDNCRILLQRQIIKKKKDSSKAKTNLLYYQHKILLTIFEEEIPVLHCKKISNVPGVIMGTWVAQNFHGMFLVH